MKITYKRYRTFCGNLIKKLKNKYNRDKITASAKNPRALWSTIDEITHYKPPKIPNAELLKVKPCPQSSVNYINRYFLNIGQTLAQNILNNHVPSEPCNLGKHNLTSFVLLDTYPEEVESILMALDSGNAPGWDGIPTHFLKLAKEILVPLICKLSFLTFSYLRSVVIPVFKGGMETTLTTTGQSLC